MRLFILFMCHREFFFGKFSNIYILLKKSPFAIFTPKHLTGTIFSFMKHHELIFSIIKIPFDFLIIWGAFFIAREIRLMTDLIPNIALPIQTIDNLNLTIFALCWACLYIGLFASHRLYSLQISHSKIAELLDIIRYSVYWFLFFSVWVYLGNGIIYSGSEIPRLIILFTMIIGMFGSIIFRIIINTIQGFLLKYKKISQRNLLLITNTGWKDIQNILDDIQNSKIYNIIWYSNTKEIKNTNISYIWDIHNLENIISWHVCDEILYIDSDYSKKDLYKIWELSRNYGVRYRYITNNFDITKTNTSLSLINQTPVIEIMNTPLENWNRVGKRTFDIFISIFAIICTFPLWIIIALLIKIEDPNWPVIYKNRRIGQGWKIFNCFKFRYLKWEHCVKESYGTKNKDDPAIELEKKLIKKQSTRKWPLYKISNDPRKTKIWAFLEKYSLDEFPQFLNVFLWEMSIIWPRPHQPREVLNYKQYQNRLLTVKPWISGMAQVNGREKNNFTKEAELDIFYIENWSFLLDLKIILKTLTIIFTRK